MKSTPHPTPPSPLRAFADWYEHRPAIIQIALVVPLLIVWLAATIKNYFTGESK